MLKIFILRKVLLLPWFSLNSQEGILAEKYPYYGRKWPLKNGSCLTLASRKKQLILGKAFFCLPITAFVFYKMSWSRNLQTNLIGEVIIISLQYLMEDGPELMLQYYFVDKYAGTNYDYPDGTTFSGRAIVVFSSFASLTVAIIGLANLGKL